MENNLDQMIRIVHFHYFALFDNRVNCLCYNIVT